ncbi:hypothetical protein FJT64_023067 [Amphibalanus amphitrite]|uniref:Uncharacterized protein n=1 Tax=Amphibalanus amphitrite TaxID=1232801 RepID=A0A6A4WRJ5_AMPAM|nr:hypothetical protein FJT64_023067 [Amphibalanus amphitrite]
MAPPPARSACARLLVGLAALLALHQRPLASAGPLAERSWLEGGQQAALMPVPRPAPQVAPDWLTQYVSDLHDRSQPSGLAARPQQPEAELRLNDLPRSSAAELLELLPMARPPAALSKRQIRYHQCYFNPIACFRRRK